MHAKDLAQWVCAISAFVAAVLWLIASFIGVRGREAESKELMLGVKHRGLEDIQYNGRLLGASSVLQARWNASAAGFAAIAALAQALGVFST